MAMLFLALCGGRSVVAQEAGADWQPQRPVTIIVPSNPGGGWDQTARFLQRAIQQEDLLPVPLEVVNRGGGGGTLALAELVERFSGDSHKLMMTGSVMVSSALMNDSKYSLEDVTPIARLTGEYMVVAVSDNSPYQSLADLIEAFEANPRSISWGGGSAGSSDQLFLYQFSEALGIPLRDVNYVAFTGGGEANVALMGGQVSAVVTGFGEISAIADSGRVRLLAVSSEQRVENSEVPTFKESGVPVTFENWRGVVAPPNISSAQKAYYTRLVTNAHDTDVWQNALRLNNWQDGFSTDPVFGEFISQRTSITRSTLQKMGVGNSGAISVIGPYFFPNLVGAGLVAIVLIFLVRNLRSLFLRTHHAPGDIAAGRPRWRRFALIVLILLLYAVALRGAGFLLSTPFFVFGMSQVISRGQAVRDALFAVLLTGFVYAVFELFLQVKIP